MANIVVCADGTWNTPDDNKDELPSPINVVKIYNALDADLQDRRRRARSETQRLSVLLRKGSVGLTAKRL